MDPLEELDRRGRALLAELAADPDSKCWRQFDDLFYEGVWKYLRANHDKLPARVAGTPRSTASSRPTCCRGRWTRSRTRRPRIALRRVREKAARFDLELGTPTKWVIGNAEYAYIEVAKTIVAARRSDRLAFVSPENLFEVPDRNPTTEEHVLRHLENTEALEDAANHVSGKEFAAIRLVITAGYSYEEAAEVIFGHATMTRQVDGLLTRGKRKLAEAWVDRKPSPRGTSGSNVPDRTDDKEGTDG